MKKPLEDVLLVVIAFIFFFSVIPVVTFSQSAFYEAMDEYRICDKCGFKAYFNCECGHCGWVD